MSAEGEFDLAGEVDGAVPETVFELDEDEAGALAIAAEFGEGEIFGKEVVVSGQREEVGVVEVDETHVPVFEGAGGDRFLEEDQVVGVAEISLDGVVGLDHDAVVAFEELKEGAVVVDEETGNISGAIVVAGFLQEGGKGRCVEGLGGAAGVAQLEHDGNPCRNGRLLCLSAGTRGKLNGGRGLGLRRNRGATGCCSAKGGRRTMAAAFERAAETYIPNEEAAGVGDQRGDDPAERSIWHCHGDGDTIAE